MSNTESRFADSTRGSAAGRSKIALGCVGLVFSLMSMLLFAPAPAGAVGIHVLDSTFTLSPAANNPNAVAVDEATGSVYVMSIGGTTPSRRHPEIQLHRHTGKLLRPRQKRPRYRLRYATAARSPSTTPAEPTRASSTSRARPPAAAPRSRSTCHSGTKVNSITARSISGTLSFCGVAVDKNGVVYTTHPSGTLANNFIDKFQPLKWETNPAQEPQPTGTVNPLDFTNPCKVAVDSTTRLTVMGGTFATSTGDIRRVNPPGSGFDPPEPPFQEATSTLVTTQGRHPAIDVSNDNLYVTKQNEVERFDSAGNLLETFGTADGLNQGQGVAVNSTNGKVYVSDRGTIDKVFIYKEVQAPVPSTGATTEVLQSTAMLHGAADPDGAGEILGCEFEYVKDQTFKSTKFAASTKAACEPATPYAASTPVSAELVGLEPETLYHVRLKASNAGATNYSSEQTFTTHAVQDLETEAATAVGPREATLHGSFTGINDETTYWFQYGTSTSYDHATPVLEAGATVGPTPLETTIIGEDPETESPYLETETTYHYRVVAENSAGTSFGPDLTFTTEPAVAGVATTAYSSLNQQGVTLNGRFTGNGEDTHYYFEYGPTTAYGMTSEAPPGTDAGTAEGLIPVSTRITDFRGYTTYHYRLVASNSFGETRGADMTFSSLAAPLPGISGMSSAPAGPGGRVLSGQVNPNRWDTAYFFEWGPTTAYGSSTLANQVITGLDNQNHPVSTSISGLAPGTVYHFRVVATNFTGTTAGPDQAFITPAPPSVDSISVTAVGQTSAHLAAIVSANGSPTSLVFQYGPGGYELSSAGIFAGQETFGLPFGVDVAGLAPGTTYHVRAVATNELGNAVGTDVTFTTQSLPSSKPARRRSESARRASSSARASV